jgi:hypothetical protein|tara:strand:- start:1007 stop:1189 length:183 start_codon:yes stop_codon:yes gene_type:complete
MKAITRDGEEYDLDVQGAIAILGHAASEHCKYLYTHETTPIYTDWEISASLALLKEEVGL